MDGTRYQRLGHLSAGVHYQTADVEYKLKARFPLPELTGRQHGPSTRLVETRARQHGPC